MANVLIIDDDPTLCRFLQKRISKSGHQALTAQTLASARKMLSSIGIDVVLLDVMLPDGNGLNLIPWVRTLKNAPEVIVLTGYIDTDGAESAIKTGAWDYLEKGASSRELLFSLERALEYRRQKQRKREPFVLRRSSIIGDSPALMQCLERMAKAAQADANVLITGETGTGKEVFAQAVHENSARGGNRLVVVDCAALPDNLVENILFGHAKGAYTGADVYQEGLVKQAKGGTLFLDEVGELNLATQKRFLRVLETRRFTPVGSQNEDESDFRLIAASNRDLAKMVREGSFREDLLFRLNGINIHLPPLRERRQDIRALTVHYITTICQNLGAESKGFTPGFMDTLMAYQWPGNVRELVNAVEEAIIEADSSPVLYHQLLPVGLRVAVKKNEMDRARSNQSNGQSGSHKSHRAGRENRLIPLRDLLKQEQANVEKRYLLELMTFTGGDISQACEISGLCRTDLYKALKRNDLKRRDFTAQD